MAKAKEINEITINGKEYPIKFGLRFIRELDKIYNIDQKGLRFGVGLTVIAQRLAMLDVTVIPTIIKLALSKEDSKNITMEMLDEWVENQDDLGALCENFIIKLETSKATKPQMDKMKAEMKAQLKEQEKKEKEKKEKELKQQK